MCASADERVSAHLLLDFWKAHSYRAAIHPATLCMRRTLLLALGGWMALPAGEDTALLIAASVLTPGYFIAEPGLLYRRWPGQLTAQPEHTDPHQWATRNGIIEARARYSFLRSGSSASIVRANDLRSRGLHRE
jgi:hypothetical protein